MADYPFTTVEPILGVVGYQDKSFVMMEVPGLLEGAHLGVGLGHQFLRHAERARVYVHLLDGTQEDPGADLDMLNNELEQFSPSVREKPQLVVVNKVDVTEVRERKQEISDDVRRRMKARSPGGNDDVPVCFISAVTGEGVDDMLGRVVNLLSESAKPVDDDHEVVVPFKRGRTGRRSSRIIVEDGTYRVQSEDLERLVAGADTRDTRVLLQLWNEMRRCGVATMLMDAGYRGRRYHSHRQSGGLRGFSMRVGVLGGTFDPIHIGHLIIAEEARLRLGLDKVIFMPAGQPRLRASDAHAPAEDRLRMVELAMADNPHFEASSLEVDRAGTTYTVDTLEELHNTFQDEVSLFFIVGEDILEKFHLWKDPERILRLCTLAVVTRKGAGSPEAGQWDSTLGCD